MNRRSFFKTISVAVGVLLTPKILQMPDVVSQPLPPLHANRDYQAIGRKLLAVQELPQGALARYSRDVDAMKMIVKRRSL